MGNESGKQEETNDNQVEQKSKDEIPADTQLSKQYIESPSNQEKQKNKEIIIKEEKQGPNHIIIKERNYENNEDGIHTKVNERKVEYHIRKVNQDQDFEDNAEQIEEEENIEQIDDNDEGEYEMNQQEELGNEEYQGTGEYITEQIFEGENQNAVNYNENYAQNKSNNAKIVINKSNTSNAEFTKPNVRIIAKDGNNLYLETGGYQSRYTSYYNDIPRYMSFQKVEPKGVGNIRSNLNVVKTEDISELIEIPREEYPSYAGRETVFIGGGMETGEYKFKGQGIIITQKGALEENVEISEEEILKEINRRKNKPKKEKRKKYEILDKFYAITEFEGKPIYKTEKMEQLQKQYEYNQQNKYSASAKGSGAFKMNSGQGQFIQTSNNENNAQFQQMQFSQYQSESGAQSENVNLSSEMMSNSIRFKNLDTTMEPSDNFSKILLSKINQLRANPQSYINTIEKAKNNIMTDKHGRLLYNAKIKIALSRGEQAFNEAIDFLRTSKATDKLIFNPYLTVEMPKSENEIKYKNDLRYKVEGLINKGIIIKSFWRDVIKDPEISFLMMIVDDIGEKSGMRRKDLLDPNMKYIGISSVEINGSFVCYFTLCTKE